MLTGELKGYESCDWPKAKKRLQKRRLLLVMEKDEMCLEVARTYESHGPDAAMAVLCVVLFFEKNGAAKTAREGVEMYWGIVKELEKRGKKIPWLRSQIANLRHWVAYSGCNSRVVWPLNPPKWKNLDRVGGLANIMLWVGASRLSEGSTSELVAAYPIIRFLREGMSRKAGKKVFPRESNKAHKRRRTGRIPRPKRHGVGHVRGLVDVGATPKSRRRVDDVQKAR